MSTEILNPTQPDFSNTIVALENSELKVLILPDMGGKILQIIRKSTGTEFFKKADIDLADFRNPQKDEPFLPPYSSGFDDCFPNVSPSSYRFKGDIIQLPDHGELWKQSWNYEQEKKQITLWTRGDLLNYRFAKHIRLTGLNVEITYELESLEEVPFDYIWSAHPLLEIEKGDELLLPNEISELILNWSSDSLLGDAGTKISWPKILGNNSNIDFNYVQEKNLSFAAKLFTNRLTQGQAGIYRKQSDESLLFSFDVNQIPYLGLWFCYGGWPDGDFPREYTVALEPCSSRPDSLEKACEWDDQQQISPSTIKCWQLQISISNGKYDL